MMAFGTGTIGSFGGAVESLFAAQGFGMRAQGQREEAQAYREAAVLADENAQFTKESTAVKETQTQRQIYLGIGATESDVAGSGFSMSGSALDILREGAAQGALTKQVLGRQGLITETGYQEQASAYRHMAAAAELAASASENAGLGAEIGAGFKLAAGFTSLFTV